MPVQASRHTGRPRPALFRALGKADPPEQVTVDGRTYDRVDVLKHDSWAATAIYRAGADRIVCKFNRRQSILGLPMGWLGKWLARREAHFYRVLADLPSVPAGCGPVGHAGRVLPNAVAHHYVEGRPIQAADRLSTAFFQQLRATLAEVHRRGIAYMDLHKRENVLVGADGRPYLIDFQVSVALPRWFPPLRWLQGGDRYHLLKHRFVHAHPTRKEERRRPSPPAWLRLHRVGGQPLRRLRRWLLTVVGIRRGDGKVQSEHFTEDGLREQPPHRTAA